MNLSSTVVSCKLFKITVQTTFRSYLWLLCWKFSVSFELELNIMLAEQRPQYIAATIVNILSFVYGLAIGWTAPMQPLLQANYTGTNESSPLGENAEPFTDEDISWISGALALSGLLSTPLMGYFSKLWGRKKTLMISAVAFIISYALTVAATAKFHIFVARVLAGIGASGTCVIAPMYAGESAQDQIRGMLASFLNLFIGIGILVAYIVGSYTSYMTLTLMCLCWSVGFLLLMMWLPESPIYLLQQDRPTEAFESLLKLRGYQRPIAEQEIITLSARVKEMKSNAEGAMSFKGMFSDQPTRRALFIILSILTFQQASGIAPVLNYTVSIFNASGSQLSSSLCTIIIGVLQLVGALIGTMLIDQAGRRILLMISSIGMTLTMAPITYYFYLQSSGEDPAVLESIGWLPVTSLSLYVVLFSVGFGPIPFVLISELFKTEAYSIASSCCLLHVWAVVFVVVKFFASVSNLLGIETCFMIFTTSSACATFFIYFQVVETKGKSQEEIVAKLCNTPVSSPLEKDIKNDGKATQECK